MITLIPIMESQGRSPVYCNHSLNLGLGKREIGLRQRSGIKRTTEEARRSFPNRMLLHSFE
ncbi:MAG: hypothetical protein AAF327_06070 [Cyanobacteria bacterium P01_A01_bin.37]